MFKAFIDGCLFLVAITIWVLWPSDTGQVVAYFPTSKSQSQTLALINKTEARLVDITPYGTSMVVWLPNKITGEKLKELGAILLSPNGLYGCSDPK